MKSTRKQQQYLFLAVFAAGMTTMALEMSASRLLGTVYGTSNLVWANIIGLILVYLTAGYFIGGRWADRSPYFASFYRLLLWGAFTSGLVPLIATPVLRTAALAVERLDVALMAGSFLSVLILFSVPVTLLGCVSPFAIRLAISDMASAGRTSGQMYAVSTLGSILGTFLPVLWIIPTLGTARTFLTFSSLLLVIAFIGMILSGWKQALRWVWMPLLLFILAWLSLRGPIKATEGQLYETESAYNYIEVVERGGMRYLLLNEGQGIHSVYSEDMGATFGTWDYFAAAPFFNPAPAGMEPGDRVGIIGLAAGTISKQYTILFGPVPIDGWEIDPEIIAVGRVWFDMNEANLNAIAEDGRWGLHMSAYTYHVIGIDAYRLPYIPFHLVTQEFFLDVRDHLDEDGVVVINVGRTMDDRRLVDAMAATMGTVFTSVYVVDVPGTFNTIIYGTRLPTRPDYLIDNYIQLQGQDASPLLLDILARTAANLTDTPVSGMVFTDDHAPIEQITNSLALRFFIDGNLDILR
ncbi:MAG: fused MFS/spermidine synthase [Anaerolineales bacterium]|nr:fused MFS/spermidine synthase [Anaerolineales bacterium]